MKKKLIFKDNKVRQNFIFSEFKLNLLRIILTNKKLNLNIRFNAFKLINQYLSKTSISKINNKCILSGRSRSIFRNFKLSRIKIRELTSKGQINGLQKISW